MNTKFPVRPFLASSLAALAFSLPSTATAGPGLDYWRRMADAKPLIHATDASADKASRECTDSRVVQITETKNTWQNGRGPLVTTTVGSKRVCTSCAVSTVMVKRTWMNGKGPTVAGPVTGQHDCNGCGGGSHS